MSENLVLVLLWVLEYNNLNMRIGEYNTIYPGMK